jgi:hypothetical protein
MRGAAIGLLSLLRNEGGASGRRSRRHCRSVVTNSMACGWANISIRSTRPRVRSSIRFRDCPRRAIRLPRNNWPCRHYPILFTQLARRSNGANKQQICQYPLPAGWAAFRHLSVRRQGLIGTGSAGACAPWLTSGAGSGDQPSQRTAPRPAIAGERQLDPAAGFLDPHRDLQQPQPDGAEFAAGQRLSAGDRVANRAHQPVGGAASP